MAHIISQDFKWYEMQNKPWSAYRISTLHRFSDGEKELNELASSVQKFFANLIQKSKLTIKSNITNIVANTLRPLDFAYEGSVAICARNSALPGEIPLAVVFCGRKSSSRKISSLYPIMYLTGTRFYTSSIIKWLQIRFDCQIVPLHPTAYEMSVLAEEWLSYSDQTDSIGSDNDPTSVQQEVMEDLIQGVHSPASEVRPDVRRKKIKFQFDKPAELLCDDIKDLSSEFTWESIKESAKKFFKAENKRTLQNIIDARSPNFDLRPLSPQQIQQQQQQQSNQFPQTLISPYTSHTRIFTTPNVHQDQDEQQQRDERALKYIGGLIKAQKMINRPLFDIGKQQQQQKDRQSQKRGDLLSDNEDNETEYTDIGGMNRNDTITDNQSGDDNLWLDEDDELYQRSRSIKRDKDKQDSINRYEGVVQQLKDRGGVDRFILGLVEGSNQQELNDKEKEKTKDKQMNKDEQEDEDEEDDDDNTYADPQFLTPFVSTVVGQMTVSLGIDVSRFPIRAFSTPDASLVNDGRIRIFTRSVLRRVLLSIQQCFAH